MMQNWKTTALGIAAILAAVSDLIATLVNGDPTHLFMDVSTISAGFVGIFAKDYDVSGKAK